MLCVDWLSEIKEAFQQLLQSGMEASSNTMFTLNSAELSEIAKELEYNLQNKIIPPAYQQTLAILTDC